MKGQLFKDNERGTKLVREWQQNQNEELATEIYNVYEEYLTMMIHKYYWVEDISGVVYEGFMKCMNDFNEESDSFSAYLVISMKYRIRNQKQYMKDPKYGVEATVTVKKQKNCNKYRTKIDRSGKGAHWDSIYNIVKGTNQQIQEIVPNNKDQYEELLNKMVIEEAATKINLPRYLEILNLTLEGYSQTELTEKFNLSQGRIATILRDFKKRNPDYCKFLHEALKE